MATDYRKTAAEAEVEIKNKDGKLQPQIVKAAAPYVPVTNSLTGKANIEETRNQAIDVAAFKDLAGISRKYAIPLLEYLDRERVTRREGDRRIVL